MFVGVIHKISDARAWRDTLGEAERSGGPAIPGCSLPISVHSAAGDYAFCLWEAPSVEALREQLDPMSAGMATNTYFPVDIAHPATNLPVTIPTQAGEASPSVPAPH